MKKGLRYRHYRSYKLVLTVCLDLDLEREIYRIGYSLCCLDIERYARKMQNVLAAQRLRELDLDRDLYTWLGRDHIEHPQSGELYVDALSIQHILDDLKMKGDFLDEFGPFPEVLSISGRLENKVCERSHRDLPERPRDGDESAR